MSEFRGVLRGLSRQPTFVLAGALSLALGMALATSVFSMVDVLFWRPLPFASPDRLVTLARLAPGASTETPGVAPAVPARDAVIAETATDLFDGVAVVAYDPHVIGANGDAQEYAGVRVSAPLFDVLRLHAIAGRLFHASDGVAGGASPIVISEGLWRTRFGGDPSIIGSLIPVDGAQRQVLGVIATGREFPRGITVWTLFPDDTLLAHARRGDAFYTTIARLSRGVGSDKAAAELTARLAVVEREAGRATRFRAHLAPLSALEANARRDSIQLWIAAAIVILLLCAVNFATMMLSRGMQRRRELAVRSACGASFPRLIGLLVLEAALIAAIGAVLTVFLAMACLAMAGADFASSVPLSPTHIDARSLAVSLVGTTTVGILFALAPAIELARADLRPLLSGGSVRATSSDRETNGRRGLVALQVALAVACVATLVSVLQVDLADYRRGPGYAYREVITGQLRAADSARWSEAGLMATLRSADGVVDAAIIRNHEIRGFRPEHAPVGIPHVFWSDVSPDFFATVRPRLIAGRLPTRDDADRGAPVAVLSERVLRWLQCEHCNRVQVVPESENFVGQRLAMKLPDLRTVWFTVIGVVADVRTAPVFSPVAAPVYTVNALSTLRTGGECVVRIRGDRRAVADRLRQTIRTYDPRVVISDVRSAQDDVEGWHADARGRLLFLGAIACLALVLAVIGVYGLTSHTAELRAREFGIRLALGATDARIIRMIAGELWCMAGGGSLIGLLLATRVIGALDSFLRNPLAPRTVISFPVIPACAAALALCIIALVGTLMPIRKALRLDIARVVASE